jgi:hypothetical protein
MIRLEELEAIDNIVYNRFTKNKTRIRDLEEPQGTEKRQLEIEDFIEQERDRIQEEINKKDIQFRLTHQNILEYLIQENLIYSLQAGLEIDLGICPYYIPRIKERRESIISNQNNSIVTPLCSFNNLPSTIETFCTYKDQEKCDLVINQKRIEEIMYKEWNPNKDPDFKEL